MKPSVFRKEVWFSGHVQGVGFRAQTLRVARGFEVTGRVENMPDGRVCLQAEGAEAEVDAFIAEVHRQLASYIRNSDTNVVSGPRWYNDFQIERF